MSKIIRIKRSEFKRLIQEQMNNEMSFMDVQTPDEEMMAVSLSAADDKFSDCEECGHELGGNQSCPSCVMHNYNEVFGTDTIMPLDFDPDGLPRRHYHDE